MEQEELSRDDACRAFLDKKRVEFYRIGQPWMQVRTFADFDGEAKYRLDKEETLLDWLRECISVRAMDAPQTERFRQLLSTLEGYRICEDALNDKIEAGRLAVEAWRQRVSELLAVIHRDGGHHESLNGVEASIKVALETVARLHARNDAYEERGADYRRHNEAVDLVLTTLGVAILWDPDGLPWIKHDGTRMPCASYTLVRIKRRDGFAPKLPQRAGVYTWDNKKLGDSTLHIAEWFPVSEVAIKAATTTTTAEGVCAMSKPRRGYAPVEVT